MMTNYMQDTANQQVLDIFKAPVRRRKKRPAGRHPVLKQQLHEVITGQRAALKVFSRTLQSDVWFINEGLVNADQSAFPGKIITMAMLAEMMMDD